MTIKAKQTLIERQTELMQERDLLGRMQTDFSYEEDFYRFCQRKMDLLGEKAEQIRYVLEMGGCE